MKRSLSAPILAATVALTLATALPASAQSDADTQKGRTGVNQDDKGQQHRRGKRIGKRIARMFKKLDSDGNGILSPAELGDRGKRASRFDSNGDGSITKDEVRATIRAKIEELRSMTPEERQAFRQERRQQRAAKLQEKDTNGDGQWSEDEAPRLVKRFDQNGDGVVTRAEIVEQRKHRKGGKRGKLGKRGMQRRGEQ
ncbi:MAG: hypothetical protein AAF581_04030 [Planctomycetota bacterium]